MGRLVPGPVRALVEQLIAKNPDDRPADAADVESRAAALCKPSSVLLPAPAPVHDDPRTPAPGWRHPLLRHPVLRSQRLHVAAAVLLAAVAGSVFVAARSPVVRVPDLRGERASVAVQRLESNGLDVRRRSADDPHARQGTVLAQRPAPGTQADDGRVVTLTVATGRTDLAAADVLGEPYDEAARDLVELGLVPSRAYRSQAAGAGTVVAVHPTGRMPLGSEVTLIVAVPGS